jgi:hypothetical protein
MRDERPFAMKKRVFKAYEGSLRNAEGDASNERGVVVTPTPGEEELMTTQSRPHKDASLVACVCLRGYIGRVGGRDTGRVGSCGGQ